MWTRFLEIGPVLSKSASAKTSVMEPFGAIPVDVHPLKVLVIGLDCHCKCHSDNIMERIPQLITTFFLIQSVCYCGQIKSRF